MIKIDLDNKAHQSILVHIALIYWSAGDVKGVYEDEGLRQEIKEAFTIETDNGIEEFLNETEDYWEDWGNLKMMPNSNHMDQDADESGKEPVYETLPVADFINERERIIVKKDGQEYIIYGPEQVGDPDNLWAVFKSLPEDQCGSDDDPDYEFTSYEALYDWFNGEDSLPEQEICM